MAGRIGTRGGASSVGMMEGAFFVSRTELLTWANGLLQMSLTKVEQCASGAVYCQIIDSCHPNTISMKKVNWMAKADHEYVPNYKVLQAAFDKNGIERHIDVDKLIRGKYQDNLEFLQFMKCYWEHEGSGRGDYDPLAAREGKQLPTWAQPGAVPAEQPIRSGASSAATGKENLRPRSSASEAEAGKRPSSSRVSPGGVAPAASRGTAAAQGPQRRPAAPGIAAAGVGDSDVEALRAKVASQGEELDELRNTVEGLEHERDYYFRKLREVEILCNQLQTQMEEAEALPDTTHRKIVTDIQDILYAETDETEQPEASAAEAGAEG